MNHKGTRMIEDGEDYSVRITDDEVEKFRLNLSRWEDCDVVPLEKQCFEYLSPYVWKGLTRIKFVSFGW